MNLGTQGNRQQKPNKLMSSANQSAKRRQKLGTEQQTSAAVNCFKDTCEIIWKPVRPEAKPLEA